MQYDFIEFCRTAGIEHANAARRLPLASRSVDVVYACHMLEHLDRADAAAFLAEARRVLTSGGVLRIAVPDLERMIAGYSRTRDADAFVAQSMLGRARARSVRERLSLTFAGDPGHKWMYDARSLVRLLTEAGFVDAAPRRAGETTIPDPGPLDLRERESETLYVEARRP